MLRRVLVALFLASSLFFACGPRRGSGDGERPATPPSPPPESAHGALSAQDLQVYLAVRSRALALLEDAVARVERGGGDPVSSVQELSVAEQRAAESYRVPWSRYSWIGNEIGRLVSLQRRAQDARVLVIELERTRNDLRAQLDGARDGASRQFIEAQMARLSVELERLGSERTPSERDVAAMALLESARAELAMLQGRQERLQRRLRESIQRARPGSGQLGDKEGERFR